MTMATEVLPRPSSIGRSTSPICRKEPLLTRPSIETEDLTRFVKVPLENATGNTGNNTDTVSSPAKAAKSAVSPSIYNALVIDSGAIIKCSGLRTLHNSAKSYYAPESVLKEILDSKSKEHLKNLPFSLQVKEPSLQSCKTISRFARLTGDYNSLSFTDIQVLALVYDLGT